MPHSTLRQKLVHVKDPTPVLQMANVIPCTTCFAVYIGQTGRLLKTQLDEHKTAVKHAKCDISCGRICLEAATSVILAQEINVAY